MYVAFPYHLDGRGHTAATQSRDEHIRQLLELLLFTRPGERVNRPDFGCGLGDLVFEPNRDRLAAALEVTIVTNVGRWLGDAIALQAVDIEVQDERLVANISYRIKPTGELGTTSLAIAVPS